MDQDSKAMFTTGNMMRHVSVASVLTSIGLMAIDLVNLLFISMPGQNTLGTRPLVVLFGMWLGAPGVLVGQDLGSVIFAVLAIWLGIRLIDNPPTEYMKRRHHHHLFGHNNLIMHILHKLAGHR